MSSSSRKWEVGASAAAIADGLYALNLNQPRPVVAQIWTKPMRGWLKLNVGGSLKAEAAGCGGVLRDSSGNWVSGFAQKLKLRRHSSYETEKEAIYRGLLWAWRRGVTKVAVESDHKGTVNLVNNGRRTTDPLIRKIRYLLYYCDWEATLDWVPRDANCVADKLAKFARDSPPFQLIELNSPPDMCHDALIQDAAP